MKTAIIIHGMPSIEEYREFPEQSKQHWLPWIKQELTAQGYAVHIPEMPEPYAPEYEQWKTVFEQFNINEETVLIGHSCGAGFLVKWLSEHKVKVSQLILVAPWLDLEHELQNYFFDFVLDTDLVQKTKNGVLMFYSTDDDAAILQSVEILKQITDINSRTFTDKGHFTADDGVIEFPELLKEIEG